jgi:hypothetical protein
MGRGRDREPDRPVEPGEARAHGNDPGAVRVEHEDDRDATRSEMNQTDRGRETGGVRRASESRRDGDGTDSLARRDSARWGPIWAGLITALTTFLLLQLLAIGLGLVGIGPNNTGGA